VAPIREQSDIYLAVSELTQEAARVARRIFANLLSMRNVSSTSTSSKQWYNKQSVGLRVCLDDAVVVEGQRGIPYSWFLRLRTDYVYLLSLPPYSSWPQWIHHQDEAILFVHKSYPGLASKMHIHGLSVKDTWGLMTRAAAKCYMGDTRQLPTACNHPAAAYEQPEASLGCTLFRGLVRVVSLVEVEGRIVRISNRSDEGQRRLPSGHLRPWELSQETIEQTGVPEEVRNASSRVVSFKHVNEVCNEKGAICMRDWSYPWLLPKPYSREDASSC